MFPRRGRRFRCDTRINFFRDECEREPLGAKVVRYAGTVLIDKGVSLLNVSLLAISLNVDLTRAVNPRIIQRVITPGGKRMSVIPWRTLKSILSCLGTTPGLVMNVHHLPWNHPVCTIYIASYSCK